MEDEPVLVEVHLSEARLTKGVNEEGKVIPAGYRTICHAESNIILDDGVSAVASYFIARTTPLYYSLRYSKVVSWLALRHLKLVGRLVGVCKFASLFLPPELELACLTFFSGALPKLW